MTKGNNRILIAGFAYSLCSVLLLAVNLLAAYIPQMEAYSPAFCLANVGLELLAVGLPLVFFLSFRSTRSLPEWRELFGKPPAAIWLIFPIALLGYFCTNGLTVAWLGVLNLFGPVTPAQSVPIPESGAQLGLGVLVIGLCPAVIEELLFRGAMQSAYSDAVKPFLRCLLVGALFALMHGQILALPAHLTLGVLLCLLVLWTRNIWCGMLLHLLQNSLSIGIAMLSLRLGDLYAQMGMEGSLQAQQELLLSNSLTTIVSGGSIFFFFLLPLVAMLALFWFLTKKRRDAAARLPRDVQLEDRVSFACFLPLLPGLAISAFLYVCSILAAYGLPSPL